MDSIRALLPDGHTKKISPAIDQAVQARLQELTITLLEPSVSPIAYISVCEVLKPVDLVAVVQDRAISNLCGLPTCANSLYEINESTSCGSENKVGERKRKRGISTAELVEAAKHGSKIPDRIPFYDRRNYCSTKCLKINREIMAQLSELSIYQRVALGTNIRITYPIEYTSSSTESKTADVDVAPSTELTHPTEDDDDPATVRRPKLSPAIPPILASYGVTDFANMQKFLAASVKPIQFRDNKDEVPHTIPLTAGSASTIEGYRQPSATKRNVKSVATDVADPRADFRKQAVIRAAASNEAHTLSAAVTASSQAKGASRPRHWDRDPTLPPPDRVIERFVAMTEGEAADEEDEEDIFIRDFVPDHVRRKNMLHKKCGMPTTNKQTGSSSSAEPVKTDSTVLLKPHTSVDIATMSNSNVDDDNDDDVAGNDAVHGEAKSDDGEDILDKYVLDDEEDEWLQESEDDDSEEDGEDVGGIWLNEGIRIAYDGGGKSTGYEHARKIMLGEGVTEESKRVEQQLQEAFAAYDAKKPVSSPAAVGYGSIVAIGLGYDAESEHTGTAEAKEETHDHHSEPTDEADIADDDDSMEVVTPISILRAMGASSAAIIQTCIVQWWTYDTRNVIEGRAAEGGSVRRSLGWTRRYDMLLGSLRKSCLWWQAYVRCAANKELWDDVDAASVIFKAEPTNAWQPRRGFRFTSRLDHALWAYIDKVADDAELREILATFDQSKPLLALEPAMWHTLAFIVIVALFYRNSGLSADGVSQKPSTIVSATHSQFQQAFRGDAHIKEPSLTDIPDVINMCMLADLFVRGLA